MNQVTKNCNRCILVTPTSHTPPPVYQVICLEQLTAAELCHQLALRLNISPSVISSVLRQLVAFRVMVKMDDMVSGAGHVTDHVTCPGDTGCTEYGGRAMFCNSGGER